ncbi:MAG TPA: hypothetical protein VHQ86_03355, partial [Candidatus Saccharimonadia bacterium]|nr:hypothetical protein [Candidatus Saccharimonadia bacterium]
MSDDGADSGESFHARELDLAPVEVATELTKDERDAALAERLAFVRAARGAEDEQALSEALSEGLRDLILIDHHAHEYWGGLRERFVSQVVAEGMATQLAEAYRGIASSGITDTDGTRFNIGTQVDQDFIELATGAAYTRFFHPHGRLSDQTERRARLTPSYWLTLGSLQDPEEGDQWRYVQRAYHSL